MAKFRLNLSFAKMGPREKSWAILWVAVVLSFLYLRMVFQPRARQVRDIRSQVSGLERQKMSLEAKQPNLKKRQEAIDSLKKEIVVRFDELTEAEQNLLDVQDVDALLESLVKDRAKFELYLNSIRPVSQKEPSAVEPTKAGPASRSQADPYRKLLIQIDLFGTFQGLLSYVDFLEQMRPYQEVQGVRVKVEGKEVSRPHALVTVSSLMGETIKEKEQRRQEIFALVEEVVAREKKDPFLTGERPKEVVPAVGLELAGIFSEAGKPVAAMINNEIYSVGQVVQGKRIVAIEPNRVLLEQGNRRFVLMPGGQQREGGQ